MVARAERIDPPGRTGRPLSAVLVGCSEVTLAEVRREIDGLGLRVAEEVPDIRAAASRRAAIGHESPLFLVEARTADDVVQLGRLNEAFPGRPIMALVDPASDPSLFLRAMRSGASQVVRVPLQVEDFRASVERLAVQFGYVRPHAEAVVVSGVKPGSGATTVAINLAAQAAHTLGLPTILLELSGQLGRLATYLNVEPSYTTQDLLDDPGRLDPQLVRQALTKIADGFEILAGPFRAIRPGSISPEVALRLIGLARKQAGGLVIDLPASFDDLYFEVMAAASRVVLVAEQKVTSLYALRMLQDALDERGLAHERVVVINRFEPRLGDITLARVEEIAGRGRVVTVANDYASVVAAENHGRLLRLESPRSRVLTDIDALARRVFGREAHEAAARPARGLSSWLARRSARP